MSIQKKRLQEAVLAYLAFERGGSHRGESEFHMSVMMDAHFLFIAIAQLYYVSRRIRDHSGSHGVALAVSVFEDQLHDAKLVRDLFEHLGDYMEKRGRLNVPWPEGARIEMTEHPEPELSLILEGQSVHEGTHAIETANRALSLAQSIASTWDREHATDELASEDDTPDTGGG